MAEAWGSHWRKFGHDAMMSPSLHLRFCMDTDLFKAPIFIQSSLHSGGDLSEETIYLHERTADRCSVRIRWSVWGRGAQMGSPPRQPEGGNGRVGLEASLRSRAAIWPVQRESDEMPDLEDRAARWRAG